MFDKVATSRAHVDIDIDQTYKNRSPSQSYIRDLDQLIELGETISDEALAEAS